MSKVTPSSQFDQFSGKLSAFDRNVLRTRNGRIHSYVIHNPYKGPLAESRKSAIPCPSPTPRVHSDSSSQSCHLDSCHCPSSQ